MANNVWAVVAVTVWIFGALGGSISLLVHRMRQTESKIERARLMYLAIGASASVAFAALDVLTRRFDLPVPTLGPATATLYLFFLAQTLLRLRLMDLHELLGKFASQTVLTIILAAVYAILTAWVSNNLSLFVFNAVLATFVVLTLLDPLRGKVEEQVVALFFRERFELIRSLTNLRDRMANVIDVGQLATLLLDGLHETRRVTHTSIYLLAEDRPGYRLLEFRGPQPAGLPRRRRRARAAPRRLERPEGRAARAPRAADRRAPPPALRGPAAARRDQAAQRHPRGAAADEGRDHGAARRQRSGDRLSEPLGRAGARGVRVGRDRRWCSRSASGSRS